MCRFSKCSRTTVKRLLTMPEAKRKEILSDFHYVFIEGQYLYFYSTLEGALQDNRRHNLFTVGADGFPRTAVTFN